MNRSTFKTIARALITWVTLVAQLVPSLVWAGTPYSIHWEMIEENPVCETAALLDHNGEAFFDVNGTPLPSFEVPGAFQVFLCG